MPVKVSRCCSENNNFYRRALEGKIQGVIDRTLLTRKQHENLLAQPRPQPKTPPPPKKQVRQCKIPKICPPRIDQLAMPTQKLIEGVLEDFNRILEAERIVRLVNLAHANRNERPKYVLKCKKKFKKRKSKKENCLKVWLNRRCKVSANLIMDSLKKNQEYMPNYRQLLISLGIFKLMKLKRRSRCLCKYTKQYLMKICEQLAIFCDMEFSPCKKIPKIEPVPSEVSSSVESGKHVYWQMRGPIEGEEEEEEEEGEGGREYVPGPGKGEGDAGEGDAGEGEEGHIDDEEREREFPPIKEESGEFSEDEGDTESEGEFLPDAGEESEGQPGAGEEEGNEGDKPEGGEDSDADEAGEGSEGGEEGKGGESGESIEGEVDEEYKQPLPPGGEEGEGGEESGQAGESGEEVKGPEEIPPGGETGSELGEGLPGEESEPSEVGTEGNETEGEAGEAEGPTVEEPPSGEGEGEGEEGPSETPDGEGEGEGQDEGEDVPPGDEGMDEETEGEEGEGTEEGEGEEEVPPGEKEGEAEGEPGEKPPEGGMEPEEALPPLVKKHPPNTVSYLTCKVYGSWMEEFGNNIAKYSNCLKRYREMTKGGKEFYLDRITPILKNWGAYLKESTEFEKGMAKYLKGKEVTRCSKCGEFTLYNIPKNHEIPDELRTAVDSTVKWKRLLDEAQALCRQFTDEYEEEDEEEAIQRPPKISISSRITINITETTPKPASSQTSMYVFEDFVPNEKNA